MGKVYSLDTYRGIKNSFEKKEAIRQSEINSQEDLEMHEKNLKYIKRLDEIEKIDNKLDDAGWNF